MTTQPIAPREIAVAVTDDRMGIEIVGEEGGTRHLS